MDIPSYILGKKSGGGGGSSYDWTAVGYSTPPQIEGDAYNDALAIQELYDTISSDTYTLRAFNRNNDGIPLELRNRTIAYPNLDNTKFLTNDVNYYLEAFRNWYSIREIPSGILRKVPTANSLNYLFSSCGALQSVDVSNLFTSAVTSTQRMFESCVSLTNIIGLNKADTSNVTSMVVMFSQCTNLTSLDLSSFDTRKVTNMNSFCSNCSGLTHITFGENFKLTACTSMSTMFNSCSKLDDETINNILGILLTATSYTGTKSLFTIFGSFILSRQGLQQLSNYQPLIDAGWSLT